MLLWKLILLVVIACLLCVLAIKFYLVVTLGMCQCLNQLHGKTVIITGANAGIGKETALDLAHRGARIILACRNVSKANTAKGETFDLSLEMWSIEWHATQSFLFRSFQLR